MTLEIGDEAPDFALPDQHHQTVRLADLRGSKNVVVVFFPMAFTGVCTGELCTIRDQIADFDSDDVQTLAISCDAGPSLARFAAEEGYTFPLLSDFWPHGATASAYGVLDEGSGLAVRGTFIIDKSCTVVWKVVNGIPDARDADEYRKVLASL
ncbi:peroxiredoxin [soil metagenome]